MSSLASAFGRPRAELRQRMNAWARSVVDRLHELGVDVVPRTLDDGDGQRVLLVPPGTPADEASARLALAIDGAHVEVGLELPPGDLGSVRVRLADPERSLELTTTLEALPEQFTVGTDGVRGPASRTSSDEMRALLDRAERDQRPLWLGWSVPRAVAVAHAARQARLPRSHAGDARAVPSLDEQLEDAMVALALVFAMLTSPPEAGAVGARTLRRDRRDRSRREEERDRTSRAAPARGSQATNGKRGARGRAREHEREHEGDVETEPESPVEHEAAPRLARAFGKPLLRAGSRRRPVLASGPAAPIDKGARVRVLEGPFCGKVGVVQELDGKGGARVMLGLLAVRIEVKHLADCAEGRDRPRLSSSHRKPLPVRS